MCSSGERRHRQRVIPRLDAIELIIGAGGVVKVAVR
jgi:hypothetical protein